MNDYIRYTKLLEHVEYLDYVKWLNEHDVDYITLIRYGYYNVLYKYLEIFINQMEESQPF